MSFDIKVEGGKPVRLPTAGKYCDQDIIINPGKLSDMQWETNFWTGVLFKGDVYGGANAGSITLPNGITQIPMNAYAYKEDLTHIAIPEGVKLIREGAFQGCKNLENVTFPTISYGAVGDFLEEIEGDTFINCSNLALNYLPSTVKSIGGSAFAYCSNLALNYLPQSIENIGSYAFFMAKSQWGSDYAPRRLVFGEKIKTIGNHAFDGCSGFDIIIFRGTPSSISPTAFANCPNVVGIEVPWKTDEVANAPWGATNATIYYQRT